MTINKSIVKIDDHFSEGLEMTSSRYTIDDCKIKAFLLLRCIHFVSLATSKHKKKTNPTGIIVNIEVNTIIHTTFPRSSCLIMVRFIEVGNGI